MFTRNAFGVFKFFKIKTHPWGFKRKKKWRQIETGTTGKSEVKRDFFAQCFVVFASSRTEGVSMGCGNDCKPYTSISFGDFVTFFAHKTCLHNLTLQLD